MVAWAYSIWPSRSFLSSAGRPANGRRLSPRIAALTFCLSAKGGESQDQSTAERSVGDPRVMTPSCKRMPLTLQGTPFLRHGTQVSAVALGAGHLSHDIPARRQESHYRNRGVSSPGGGAR